MIGHTGRVPRGSPSTGALSIPIGQPRRPGTRADPRGSAFAPVITPQRFRTRQQFWSYCGLGIVTRSRSDRIQTPDKKWQRAWVPQTRGLSKQHSAELKAIFKGAAHHRDHPAHRDTDAGRLPSEARQRNQAQPGEAHRGAEDRSYGPARANGLRSRKAEVGFRIRTGRPHQDGM